MNSHAEIRERLLNNVRTHVEGAGGELVSRQAKAIIAEVAVELAHLWAAIDELRSHGATK